MLQAKWRGIILPPYPKCHEIHTNFCKVNKIYEKKFLRIKIFHIFAPAKAISQGGTGPVAQLDRATDF